MRRAFGAVGIWWVVLAGALSMGATECDSPEQQSVLNLVNADRRSVGVHQLAYDGVLGLSADELAGKFAAGAALQHPPISGWCTSEYAWCAENIGYATTLSRVHQAFKDSPGHWANIVSTQPRIMGTGYAVGKRNGVDYVYVVHRFARKR